MVNVGSNGWPSVAIGSTPSLPSSLENLWKINSMPLAYSASAVSILSARAKSSSTGSTCRTASMVANSHTSAFFALRPPAVIVELRHPP